MIIKKFVSFIMNIGKTLPPVKSPATLSVKICEAYVLVGSPYNSSIK